MKELYDNSDENPLINAQLGSIHDRLEELRKCIIRGLETIENDIHKVRAEVKQGKVPYGINYGDRMSKMDRLLIRYTEVKEMHKAYIEAVKGEQSAQNDFGFKNIIRSLYEFK